MIDNLDIENGPVQSVPEYSLVGYINVEGGMEGLDNSNEWEFIEVTPEEQISMESNEVE